MFTKRTVPLIAAVALAVAAAAPAGAHHETHAHTHLDPSRVPWSGESRRLAEVCRRDPSEENRAALRRQLERDFDRFIADQRAKLKPGKKHHDQRHRLESLTRERERVINAEMHRLLDGRDKKPRPPRDPR